MITDHLKNRQISLLFNLWVKNLTIGQPTVQLLTFTKLFVCYSDPHFIHGNMYSGDLNNRLVWYSNGRKQSNHRMVRYSNGIWIADNHSNIWHSVTGLFFVCYSNGSIIWMSGIRIPTVHVIFKIPLIQFFDVILMSWQHS